MRLLIISIITFFISFNTICQDIGEPISNETQLYTDDYIYERMDSAWDYLEYGRDKEKALGIASELLNIEEDHNTYMAEVNAYQIIGEYHYWSSAIDSAKHYYQIANDIARAAKDSSEIAYTLLALGSLSAEQSKYDTASYFFQQAIDIRLALKDTNDILFILNRRAWMNNDADKHNLAMQDYFECLRIAELATDTAYISASLNGIAVVHKKQENFELSVEYFTKSAEIAEAHKSFYDMYAAIGNRAMVYKSMGQYEKAFEPMPEVYAFYDSVNYTLGKMSAVANMTVIMNRMGNYEKVMEYGKEALQLGEELEQKQTQADMLNELAMAYLATGDAQIAAEYSERSKVLADETYYVEKQKDARKTLTDIYDTLGNYREALLNHREYKALYDTMFQKEKTREILQLQTLYETEKKEREIEKLEAEAELDELNRSYLIAGIIMLIILFSIILNREMQRRKKAKQLAEAEQERLEDKIEFQNRELTSQALNLARKNEMLQEIKNDLEAYRTKTAEGSPSMRGLFQKINFDKQIDKNWEQFTQTFTKTNASFIQNLTSSYPDLTKNDLRLAALLRMNLSSKDIATILNISDDGVKKARYRLRKKLNLETSDSLDALVMAMN